MRNIIISICIIGLFLELSGLIWSAKKDKPSEAFVRLSAPPAHNIEHPLENGYFLLLGMAASGGMNPVQTGYDIWLEAGARPMEQGFDLDKPGRTELRLPVTFDRVVPEWHAADPLSEFQNKEASFRSSIHLYAPLVTRYEQWLRMRFEDWGYGHTGTPRIEELMGAHRLFVASGFGDQVKTGLDRVTLDIAKWRTVLREARTLPIKMLAAVMIEDNVELLSRMLSQTTVDKHVLAQGLTMLQPLTATEYSLRWPIQNEFMMGYQRSRTESLNGPRNPQISTPGLETVATLAHLPPSAFQKIAHPKNHTGLWFSSTGQRTWDAYASYYDTTIKTAETIHSPLPRLHDIAKHSQRTFLERLADPMEFEPQWEPFSQRLVETDARLRLVSLQILMRKPTATATIPTRLAEVGSMYFDPFTGLPMLWSPTQKKLYSAGKDRLDDGGDPSFDIAVPLPPTLSAPAS
ncbi:MAG: hypothetical protein ABL970_05970 [Nitrospira sp.]